MVMHKILIAPKGYDVIDDKETVKASFVDSDGAVAYLRTIGSRETAAMKTMDMGHAKALAAAVDASLDHAASLMKGMNTSAWPPAAKRAWQLVMSAGTSIDELLKVMGVPDDDADDPK